MGLQNRVHFVNNDGGGFADLVEVRDPETVREFFSRQMEGDPNGYRITVNGQPARADQQLHDGDRVAITPMKVEGAN